MVNVGRNDNWTLISSHGYVLFYLAENPDATIRNTAEASGLTERRVADIIHELAEAGLISITRRGRRNSYQINESGSFRHPTLSHLPVGLVLRAFRQHENSSPEQAGQAT
jgi:DNA-binding Lrp family transcriptional regulator